MIASKEVLMATRYRMIGNLSPADRVERYQVDAAGEKVLELNGDALTLTDAQAAKAREYVVLQEIPEGVDDAQYGPANFPDSEADKEERKAAAARAAEEAPRGEKQDARAAAEQAGEDAEAAAESAAEAREGAQSTATSTTRRR